MPYVLAPMWEVVLPDLSEDELWDHYAKCLSAHDWLYMFSSDPGVLRAGTEQCDHLTDIISLTTTYNEERSDEMYNTACPYLNDDGTRMEDFK